MDAYTVSLYTFLANTLLVLHALYILFVLLGSLLALYSRWWIWLHIPALIWGVTVELTGWICPLTVWENTLRYKAGLNTYNTDFINHYLTSIIYPTGLTRFHQILLGSAAAIINVILYFIVFRKKILKTEQKP
ncbi:MAG: DUF2784 domain-containing protein [Syntrophales bacterium]|nr:DUF2784 domain-containing protein [Syntrophales bacterium]